MCSNAQLVVVVRCPLCGSWILNTRFREHQSMVHAIQSDEGFSGPPGASSILEIPAGSAQLLAAGSAPADAAMPLGELLGLEPDAVTRLLADVRSLIAIGVEAALAFHMWNT